MKHFDDDKCYYNDANNSRVGVGDGDDVCGDSFHTAQ
jgi:hypothetical protein